MSLFVPYHTMVEGEDATLSPMSQYSSRDPWFSVPSMQSRVSNLCIQLMFGLCDGDMEPLEPYVTPELLRHFTDQAEALRRSGQQMHVERPCVLRSEILGFRALPGEDHVHVRCQTRCVQYVTDSRGRVISGDRSREEFSAAVWVFSRPVDEKTERNQDFRSWHCPGCGAAFNVYTSAKCPYCGRLVPVRQFNWIANAILDA